MAKYKEDERRAYAELAGDIGIRPAMRELGYPSSWATADKWCKEFGIVVELDELKAKASAFNMFYHDTEQTIAYQDLIADARAKQLDPATSPSDLERLAKTIKMAIDGIRLIQGKATTVRASNEDTTEVEALKLYDEFQRSRADDA